MTVRTRIAPSPTGFLHLGTARTALYSWAYARHHGGQFVLRIEDTDVARSTQDAVDQILASMHWLGLDFDEGPIYQMQRLARYQAVAEQLVAAATPTAAIARRPSSMRCARPSARAARRRATTAAGAPSRARCCRRCPPTCSPVIRLKNPLDGNVAWHDLVKGPISISNREIDDLILVRPDGVPTYNFAVVVDDWDMRITHVFRGDEHVNNTPWQINIFRALGAPLPQFGHCPIILGDDGLKLSKRRGAVSVTAYEEAGYLPEAMLNYLARLGWSHGDEELFTREQMVAWFDGSHLAQEPGAVGSGQARLGQCALHQAGRRCATGRTGAAQLATRGVRAGDLDHLSRACALFKDRCSTTVELADWLQMYFAPVTPSAARPCSACHADAVQPALRGPARSARRRSPGTRPRSPRR